MGRERKKKEGQPVRLAKVGHFKDVSSFHPTYVWLTRLQGPEYVW